MKFNQKNYVIKRIIGEISMCDYEMLVAIERFIIEIKQQRQNREIAQEE